MELGLMPRRGRWRPRWSLVALVVALPVLAVTVIPAALGLGSYVIASDGVVAHGSLAVVRKVPTTDLRPGDLIVAPRAGDDASGERVVLPARVEAVTGPAVTIRTDPDDAATVRIVTATTPTTERVVLAIPLVGLPLLVLPGLGWCLLVAGAVALLLLTVRRPRPAVSPTDPPVSAYASDP